MYATKMNSPLLGVDVVAPASAEFEAILTPEALEFAAELDRRMYARRQQLLRQRAERQARLDAGERPAFLAETAEISRAQIWQWIRHPKGRFADGTKISGPLVETMLREELAKLRESMGPAAYAASRFEDAGELFLSISTAPDFVEFLTLPAYEQLG